MVIIVIKAYYFSRNRQGYLLYDVGSMIDYELEM